MRLGTNLLGAATFAGGLALASMGQAATLVINNGSLMGATGVDVDGVYYDVSFVDGSCAALFDGCNATTDFTFQTYASAQLASQALLDQVFIETDTLNFDADPELTNGITSTSTGEILTPYVFEELFPGFSLAKMMTAKNAYYYYYNGVLYDRDQVLDNGAPGPTYDLSNSSNRTFAVWSLSAVQPTAAVPLPAGAWLMSAALGGLGLVRRLQKRA